MDTTKLCKTLRSIRNFTARGGSLNAIRGQQLVDRYNALRFAVLNSNLDRWNTYCDETGMSREHTGYDLFC